MFLYIIYNGIHHKIGIAVNPDKRIKELQTGSSNKLQLLRTYEHERSALLEKSLHALCLNDKSYGEWFTLNDKQINAIDSIMDLIGVNIKRFKIDIQQFKTIKINKDNIDNKPLFRIVGGIKEELPTYPDGVCKWCGTDITSLRKGSKFCTADHKNKWWNLYKPSNKRSVRSARS